MNHRTRSLAATVTFLALITSIGVAGTASAFPPGRYAVFVDQTATPDPVSAGGTLQYDVVVRAVGPIDIAPNAAQPRVFLVDKLSAEATFVSVTVDYGDTCTDILPDCIPPLTDSQVCEAPAGGALVCDLGPISRGYLSSGVTVSIVVTAPSTPGTIINTAFASGVANTGLLTDVRMPVLTCGVGDIDCTSTNISVLETTVN